MSERSEANVEALTDEDGNVRIRHRSRMARLEERVAAIFKQLAAEEEGDYGDDEA